MNKEIAKALKTAPKTVSLWRRRFAGRRLAGIEKDSPRGGRPPQAREQIARAIVAKTTASEQNVQAQQPIHPGRCGTMTADMAEGKLIGSCMTQQRHQEWIKFLRQIDTETPANLDLHFIPTSSSWLNLIERWFREITTKRLRRGTFRNGAQLIEAILSFIKEQNRNPRAFTWTAKADEILAKIERARKILHKTPTA